MANGYAEGWEKPVSEEVNKANAPLLENSYPPKCNAMAAAMETQDFALGFMFRILSSRDDFSLALLLPARIWYNAVEEDGAAANASAVFGNNPLVFEKALDVAAASWVMKCSLVRESERERDQRVQIRRTTCKVKSCCNFVKSLSFEWCWDDVLVEYLSDRQSSLIYSAVLPVTRFDDHPGKTKIIGVETDRLLKWWQWQKSFIHRIHDWCIQHPCDHYTTY